MNERLNQELDLLKKHFGEANVEADPNGSWVGLRQHPLPAGWNMRSTPLRFRLQAAYPQTPPDNFCADLGLRLAAGNPPGNVSGQDTLGDKTMMLFSYHLEAGDWSPHADPRLGHNLITYFEGVFLRLGELS